MSLVQKKAAAAALHQSINNPDTHIVTNRTYYNVDLGTAPNWLKFDTPTRYGVKINAGHAALGDSVIRVVFQFRTYGNADDWGVTLSNPFPFLKMKVGVRKIADDSFVQIAEHPVSFEALRVGQTQTAIVESPGAAGYNLVAGDHVTLEVAAATGSNFGVEIPVSTTEAFPTNTVSQVYSAGSWANTASNRPLAVSITSRVLIAI